MVILGVVAKVADNWADKVNELLGASSATIKRSGMFPAQWGTVSLNPMAKNSP